MAAWRINNISASSSSLMVVVLCFVALSATLASGHYTATIINCPPPPPPPSSPPAACPRDALKLGVCANVLGLIKGVKVGMPPIEPCCPLLDGLIDLEAAVCLCTALKANILGIRINLPIDLSLVLNHCGKNVPSGFHCA